MKYEHPPFVLLIYMANEYLETSKALKSCEEIQESVSARGDSWSHSMGHFLLYIVKPPTLVLRQSCDMLCRAFVNTEVTLYPKKFKLIPQSEKKDILQKAAIKREVLHIMKNFN